MRSRRDRPRLRTGSASYQRPVRPAFGPSVLVPSRRMKSALAIIAGLLVGVLAAAAVLAAFVLVGPDPVGLRPTPSPSAVPSEVIVASPSIAPSASPSVAPLVVPSGSPSTAPSGSPAVSPSGSARIGGSPAPSGVSQAGFLVDPSSPRRDLPPLAALLGRSWSEPSLRAPLRIRVGSPGDRLRLG